MLKIVYSPKHKLHNPKYEVYDGKKEDYSEILERIEMIRNSLKKNKIGEFIQPKIFPLQDIQKVHDKQYVNFLKNKSKGLNKSDNFFPSYFIIDTYTPITYGTFQAAKLAVDCALTGAEIIQKGEKLVYVLCRPPGHHAGVRNMGGYCYFNNAAIAADYLSKVGRVAILDIDYHHGNGTQQIFYDRKDVLYVSLHADPNKKYPYISGFKNEIGIGKGEGFNKNYPLPLDTSENFYRQTLQKALNDIVNFKPNYLVLSAGFDTYKKDPIGGFKLHTSFYKIIGQYIASLHFPTLIIQEGGYYLPDIGNNVLNLLKGLLNDKI